MPVDKTGHGGNGNYYVQSSGSNILFAEEPLLPITQGIQGRKARDEFLLLGRNWRRQMQPTLLTFFSLAPFPILNQISRDSFNLFFRLTSCTLILSRAPVLLVIHQFPWCHQRLQYAGGSGAAVFHVRLLLKPVHTLNQKSWIPSKSSWTFFIDVSNKWIVWRVYSWFVWIRVRGRYEIKGITAEPKLCTRKYLWRTYSWIREWRYRTRYKGKMFCNLSMSTFINMQMTIRHGRFDYTTVSWQTMHMHYVTYWHFSYTSNPSQTFSNTFWCRVDAFSRYRAKLFISPTSDRRLLSDREKNKFHFQSVILWNETLRSC